MIKGKYVLWPTDTVMTHETWRLYKDFAYSKLIIKILQNKTAKYLEKTN